MVLKGNQTNKTDVLLPVCLVGSETTGQPPKRSSQFLPRATQETTAGASEEFFADEMGTFPLGKFTPEGPNQSWPGATLQGPHTEESARSKWIAWAIGLLDMV